MLNILFWLIFGILSGWITVLVAEPEAGPRRVFCGVVLGAAGGLVGGSLDRIVRGLPLVGGIDTGGLIFAVLFAIGFTLICQYIRLRRS